MINTSEEFKQKILKNRIFHVAAKILLRDETALDLDEKNLFGFSVEDNVSGTNSFDIGGAIINQLTLKLDNTDGQYNDIDFEGALTTVKIGLELSSTIEWLNKGVYTADPGEDTGAMLTIKAVDNMHKFDKKYSESQLIYPATLASIVQDACDVCGVTLLTTAFPRSDYIVENRPMDVALTFRDVLSQVGQIACQWCRCDELGRLKLDFFDTRGYESGTGYFHKISNLSSKNISTTDVVITGVKVIQEIEQEGKTVKAEYLSGEEGYVISIENNDLIGSGSGQTVADMIGEKVIGLRFRKMSISHQSDPSIEAGDLAIVRDGKREYKTLITGTAFHYGGSQKSECSAESPRRNSAERFSQGIKNYVKNRENAIIALSNYDATVQQMTQLISQGFGMYMSKIPDENGGFKYYMHDKPTIEESSYVCQMTSNGLMASLDGGTTWAIDKNGNALYNVITARGINAEWITAGRILVKTKDGKPMFLVDMDTGQVFLDGSCVQIGGKTAEDAINDALNAAANAKNMTMQLSSDYETVNVDDEGNYKAFPNGISTTPTVMYGSADITKDCTITVTKSDFIQGSWNNVARTYTVTGLTADAGWVDIKAVYLNTLTVVKRFTVAKLYAGTTGPPGEDGISFDLEPSVGLLKADKDGGMVQPEISFCAYMRKGEKTDRIPYDGRFRIRETADGVTWNTFYESTTDESEVTHHLRTAVSDADGSVLVDANGTIPGDPREIYEMEVTLYAAGGFDHAIKMDRIPVTKDVETLSQKDVFDKLTNNGEWQGIFYQNGTMFINASYMVAGILSDKKGINFWNLETGEFHLNGYTSAEQLSQAVLNANQYAQQAAKSAVDAQTQLSMFNKLTNNGQVMGIVLANGVLYINANYINAGLLSADRIFGGTMTLGGANNNAGRLVIMNINGTQQLGYIDNTGVHFNNGYFSGEISTKNGYIGGWKIVEDHLQSQNGRIKLYNDGRIVIGGCTLGTDGSAFTVRQGIHIYTGSTGDFDDGSRRMKIFGLSHVSEGGHLVFGQDGATVCYASSSSRRYKNHVRYMETEDINPIYEIRPVFFKYKDGYLDKSDPMCGKSVPGFYAEDVAEKISEAVYKNAKGQIENWSERYLMPYMLKAIQEQNEEIKKLKAIITKGVKA